MTEAFNQASLDRAWPGFSSASAARRAGEIRRRQIAAKIGIADFTLFQHHFRQAIVREQDDLERKPRCNRGRQVGHQHCETAITDHSTQLPVGMGQLRCDRERESPGPCWPAFQRRSGADFHEA